MKNARNIFLVSTAFAVLCSAGDALDGFRQIPPSPNFPTLPGPTLLEQARLAVAAKSTQQGDVLRELLDVTKHLSYFVQYRFGGPANNDALQKFLMALENARTDEQNGTAAGGSAGTSIVSKPGTTAILAAAVEAGALTQTTSNGSEVTFRGNFVGVTRMLLNDDVYPFCKFTSTPQSIAKSCEQGVVRVLKPLTFSITVDPNGQKAVTVPVTGSATQATAATTTLSSVNLPSASQRVAAWGVRYALRDPHALDSAENRATYFKGLETAGGKLATDTGNLMQPIINDGSYMKWRSSAIDEMTASFKDTGAITPQAFEQAFAQELDKLADLMTKNVPNFATLGRQAWEDYQAYFAARETALDSLNNATMLTLEYNHDDPLNQPSISNVRFVFSRQMSKSVMLTGNLAMEIYNTLPQASRVSRFRDAQAAAEIDISLKPWGQFGAPVLSAAGYFQYQQDPALINITNANLAPGTNIALPTGAATVLGQKGSIGIGQVKLTIPFKSTGVSFPIGVTWSNRTELIKASDVSGHVGISFDLDSLFTSKSSAKTQ